MSGLSFGKGFSFGAGLEAFGGTKGMSFGAGFSLPAGGSVTGSILLEDGVNFIELEDGSGTILLDG